MAKRLLLLAFFSVAVFLLLSCMIVTEQEAAPVKIEQNEELFLRNNVSAYINTEPNLNLIDALSLICVIYCAVTVAACRQPVVDANGRVISCKAYYRCAYEAFLINERAG